jgi:hypothetical protein
LRPSRRRCVRARDKEGAWLEISERRSLPMPRFGSSNAARSGSGSATSHSCGVLAVSLWPLHRQAAERWSVDAGAIFDWTRPVGGQVAHGSLLFLITLLALFGLPAA